MGFAATFGCAQPARLPDDRVAERSSRRGDYRFIDPLLDCAHAEDRREVRPFRMQLQALADRQRAGKNATLVAAYFRDLRNGAWFGINEKEEFLPASLLKVPMMISVFRAEDEQSGVLTEVLSVPKELPASAQQHFTSRSPIVLGSTYPASALVSAMVRQSDNAAMFALFDRHGASGIQALYGELGVTTPDDGVPDRLRVKDYAVPGPLQRLVSRTQAVRTRVGRAFADRVQRGAERPSAQERPRSAQIRGAGAPDGRTPAPRLRDRLLSGPPLYPVRDDARQSVGRARGRDPRGLGPRLPRGLAAVPG